jgi:hypothetical protein
MLGHRRLPSGLHYQEPVRRNRYYVPDVGLVELWLVWPEFLRSLSLGYPQKLL